MRREKENARQTEEGGKRVRSRETLGGTAWLGETLKENQVSSRTVGRERKLRERE